MIPIAVGHDPIATKMPATKRGANEKRLNSALRRKGQDAAEALAALREVKNAQVGGDALSAPAVEPALRRIIKSAPDAEKQKTLEQTLHDVRNDIQSLPSKLSALKKGFVASIDERSRPTKTQLEQTIELGTEPLRVSVVGSFLLGLWREHADVVVHVPEKYYGDRDVANYRYHQKRALLLAQIAKHLKEKEWDVELGATHHAGIPYKPLLCVRKDSVTVRVHLLLPNDVFPGRMLARDRRNVRDKGESAIVENPADATPAYNASIAMDASLLKHLRIMHEAKSSTPNFIPAVRMLLAWGQRRRIFDGSFLPAAIIANALMEKAAPNAAGANHLLRVAFARIRSGILTDLHLAGVPVCAVCDDALSSRAQQEASAAIAVLDAPTAIIDPWLGALPALFVTARGGERRPVPTATLFDSFVRVNAGHDGKVGEILNEALVGTDRAASVEMLSADLYGVEWSSPAAAKRKVDLCPNSTSEEHFREFWGEKVQLRRFSDGKIKPALVWEGGARTLDAIVQYVAERHLDGLKMTVFAAQIEETAQLSNQALAEAMRAHQALNELSKTMRALEGLPLRITDVVGVSPRLRGADVLLGRPQPRGRFVEPIDCVLEFESSRSWPVDPVALAASKAGFYVALREALASSGISAQATISSLEIYLGGFVFRLRLRVPTEKDCFKEGSADRAELVWQTEGRPAVHNTLRRARMPVLGMVTRVAKRWLGRHLLFSQLGPRRHELVELIVAKALEGPNARAAGSVLCGFARFLQLLAEFPWETAPLVVSSMRESDDDEEVDRAALEDSRDEGATLEAFAEFEKIKKSKRPSMAIVPGECPDKFAWFDCAPDLPVVKRMIATAVAASTYIEGVVQGRHSADSLKTLFRTPIKGEFQVELVLDPALCPKARLKKGPMRAPVTVGTLEGSLVDFDPAERLRDRLEEKLGDMAWFMHDSFGGESIYVAWRKNAVKERPFSVRAMRFSTPDPDTGKVVPDRVAMLEEIRRIGKGLVIDVRHLSKDDAFKDEDME